MSNAGKVLYEDSIYVFEVTKKQLIIIEEAIANATSEAEKNTLRSVRAALDWADGGINKALGKEAPLSKNQVVTNDLFKAFDSDGNDLLSWPEWKEFVIYQNKINKQPQSKDLTYWI